MKSKGCRGCHDYDRMKVGAAYKDVAAKYKTDKGAASDAELKAAVGHVLSTK